MKKILLSIIMTLVWVVGTYAQQSGTGTDKLILGKPSSSSNKSIEIKGYNGKLRWNSSTTKWEFSNDGSSYKAIGAGGTGGSGINLLVDNADFEAGISANWTNSGGSYTALSAVGTALQDLLSPRFNASASGQYVRSDAYTIPVGLQSGACLGSFRYKTTESTNKYRIRALDGDDDSVLAYADLDSTNGITLIGYVGFICPSSGTVKLEMYSTGDAADIDFDNGYIGSENRESYVSQANMVGAAYFATTASCIFTRTNTSLGALSDSDCPGPTVEINPGPGTIQTTDADAPKVTVSNLPPGNYEVCFLGANDIASSIQKAAVAINDGTTTSGQVAANNHTNAAPFKTCGHFNYTSTANRTFELYASSAANAFNIDISAGNLRLYFYILRFPNSYETGLRVDQLGWHVDASISGANPSLGTSAQTSYIGIEDSGLTLTNNSGTGAISAQIPCSSTNAPSGTTCAVGNESVGISFNVPNAGDVLACASFSHNIVTAASGIVNSTFEIVETPTNAQTISQEGKGRVQSGFNTASSTITFPHRVCGTFTFATAGQKVLRLFYEQAVTATVTTSQLFGDAGANNGQRDIHWEVYPLNYLSGALPIFKGMVTSDTSGRDKMVRVKFYTTAYGTVCSADPCGVTSSNGSLTVTRNNTGDYTINFPSGTYSAAPTCTVIASNSSNTILGMPVTASSTTYNFTTKNSSSGAAANTFGDVLCMGPN